MCGRDQGVHLIIYVSTLKQFPSAQAEFMQSNTQHCIAIHVVCDYMYMCSVSQFLPLCIVHSCHARLRLWRRICWERARREIVTTSSKCSIYGDWVVVYIIKMLNCKSSLGPHCDHRRLTLLSTWSRNCISTSGNFSYNRTLKVLDQD